MEILERTLHSHPLLACTDPETGSSVEVFPRGATVHQITLAGPRGDLRPVLYPMRTEVEIRNQRWAKGAQLAPWPNRIQDAVYTFQGREYRPFKSFRSQGGHAMHGTVMNEAFRLDRKALDQGILALELTSRGWEGYPWPLRTRIALRFADGGLRMDVEIENRGKTAAPAGHGWHPYFTLGRDVRECTLQVPDGLRLGMTARSVPDGTKAAWSRFRSPERIGPDFLNDCIEVSATAGRVATRLGDPDTGETLEVWQDAGAGRSGYVQVFTHPRRHCLAVEPMTCAPNAFQNGWGLVVLEPGEVLRTSCGVRRI